MHTDLKVLQCINSNVQPIIFLISFTNYTAARTDESKNRNRKFPSWQYYMENTRKSTFSMLKYFTYTV